MLVLVTGLDGFTGRYVQSELEAHGHVVVGLACDLTDSEALVAEIIRVRAEAVVHLAAVAFVGHGDASAFYDVNLIGTRNLLDALAQHAPNVKSILLASSANIYGNRSEGLISEATFPDPANDYAVSKYAMELMASLWVNRLPIFIVRPFNYTGRGQDENFLIPKIAAHFRERKSTIELGNLEIWREFGDVRVVADIYRRLIECQPVGGTFNVCSGRSHSLKDVILMCEKITGHTIKLQVNPSFVRDNEVKVLAGDNARLKEVIGSWQEHTLDETLSWMLGGQVIR